MRTDTSAAVDHLRETPVARRKVFDGRLLRVFADEVRLPDGSTARREVVEHPGAVAVIAVDDRGRVVLVRQWRHAVGGAVWEIPAGTRDGDEDPAATAVRELAEETGYRAASWRRLGVAAVSPGYTGELLTFFVARGLRPGSTGADPDERLDVALMDGDELARLVAEGRVDCKTVGGLALAGLLPAVEGEPVEPPR